MSLKENLSRLSPNEFLEKMQNMFQMYQESQEDYYEEGIKNLKKAGLDDPEMRMYKKNLGIIERFLSKIMGVLRETGVHEFGARMAGDNKNYWSTLDRPLFEIENIGNEDKKIKISLIDYLSIIQEVASQISQKGNTDFLQLRESMKKYGLKLDHSKNPERLPK